MVKENFVEDINGATKMKWLNNTMEESMFRIKLFFARLFCLHQWEYNMVSHKHLANLAVYGQGILKPYVCKKCGKECLSFVEPLSYYK